MYKWAEATEAIGHSIVLGHQDRYGNTPREVEGLLKNQCSHLTSSNLSVLGHRIEGGAQEELSGTNSKSLWVNIYVIGRRVQN